MFPTNSIGASLIAAALLIGCNARSNESPRSNAEPKRESVTPVRPNEDAAQLSGSLEVAVSAPDNATFPEGSVLRVTLSDVSKADAPAEVVAEQSMPIKGAPPFVVTLTYDRTKIQNRSRYAVSARVQNEGKEGGKDGGKDGGTLLFTTDTNHPALTGGAPKTRVEAALRAASAGGTGG